MHRGKAKRGTVLTNDNPSALFALSLINLIGSSFMHRLEDGTVFTLSI